MPYCSGQMEGCDCRTVDCRDTPGCLVEEWLGTLFRHLRFFLKPLQSCPPSQAGVPAGLCQNLLMLHKLETGFLRLMVRPHEKADDQEDGELNVNLNSSFIFLE